MKRSNWHEYFMKITRSVAERSTCPRAAVGAVIVKNRSILSTGYNGAPSGQKHCTEVGCLVYESKNPFGETEKNCYRTTHAEMNAVIQAAKNGTAISGADIYITHSPCYHCLKALINAGIRNIYIETPYKIHTIKELIENSDLRIYRIHSDGKLTPLFDV